jgi:hypothetical protein
MTEPDPPPADPASRFFSAARVRRTALWLAGIVGLVAAVGFGVAPPIVRSQAEKVLTRELGRVTTIEKVAINPFAPSITVSGFKVLEADGKEAFLSFDELFVRASYTSVFRLAPVIDAVRLSKPQVRIVRTAAQRFNFSDIQDKLAAAPNSDEAPKPLRFAVYNIELTGGGVDIEDQVKARRHAIADIDLALPFVSSLATHRAVVVEPRFSARLDGAVVRAEAKAQPFADTRASSLSLVLQGFDLPPWAVYSPQPVPFTLVSGKLDLDLGITFAQPAGAAPSIVISGKTELKSLAADFPTGGPLLRVASLSTEISAVEPLAGRYEIARVTLQSPEVWVRRDKGGAFALAPLFRGAAPTAAPAAKAAPAASAPAAASAKPLNYRLDEFSIEGGLVHWLDERGSRPIAVDLGDLRATLRKVSSVPGSKLSFEASGLSDLKESLALEGEATLQPIDVSGKLRVGNIALPRLWPLAEPFLAAALTKGRLDAGTSFKYDGRDDVPRLVLDGIEAKAADVVMRQPGAKQDFLQVAAFDLRDGAFDLVARRVSLGTITTRGLRLNAVRQRDGSFDLQALLPPPAGAPSVARAGTNTDTASGKPFLLEFSKASLDNCSIRVDDRTRAAPFTWTVEPLSATMESFSTAPGATASVAMKATLNRKGTLTAAGKLGLSPLAARLQVEARALDIAPLQRFIDDRVNVTVTSGLLSTRGKLSLDLPPGKPPRAAWAGELNLADFATVDKTSQQDLLKWKSLFVGGIDVDLEPLQVSVGEVALSDFYSRFIVNPDGTLNLQNILVKAGQEGVSTTAPTAAAGAGADPKPPAEPASAAAAAVSASAPAGLPARVRLGKITLQGGNVDFSDFFIKPNFSAKLSGIGGSVSEMSPEKAADLELRGMVNGTAPVEITGRLNPLASSLMLDIKASARDIELPPLTAYSVKYAGYGIEKGKLSVTVKYLIENRKLSAENKLYIDQLTFGDKVESPTATKLPVLLAVSLLQDRNGVIDIDLPISGSLDDPQFSVGGLVVKVIVNLLTKIITAPFSALASAFGGKEEMSQVDFAAGSATLDDNARKRLDALAKALNDRPALKMDVAGHAAADADREALKQADLARRVKAEKMKRLARDGKAPASVDEVVIAKDEYPELLKAAYREAPFPKPRNAIGMTKDLPDAEMESLMLANAQVSEQDIAQLASRRALAAKGYLVETGKVPAERIFLVAPKAGDSGSTDKGKSTRAEFALK